MAKGMWDSWKALRDELRDINGSTGGYWYSFNSDSVLEKIVLPEEAPGLADPYLCVPLLEDTERFEEQEQHSVRPVSNHTVVAFARDDREDLTETSTPEFICKIRDDVVRMILTDHTLSGKVASSRLVGSTYTAGAELEYGVLEMVIEITQFVDLNDIGSAA